MKKGYVIEDTIDSRLILKAVDIRTHFPTDANLVTVKKALLLAYTKHYFYPVFDPSYATFSKEISNFVRKCVRKIITRPVRPVPSRIQTHELLVMRRALYHCATNTVTYKEHS